MNKTMMLCALTALSLGLTGPAFAHPKLVSSTPSAAATVTAPRQVTVTFSETLMPALSGAEVLMTGMPGMKDHSPMKINGARTSVATDGKTLQIAFNRPLGAGSYAVNWHAVSGDTHRVTGSVTFTVR
ncbi:MULTISPECIES: copper homeostasis periplasmic binding protein CopC [Novosphingobium]|uniref:copper homeostasis periplasmic binding protein CopC n=1 Tax=Novosphingobium TaxID=165696 RepID=UPI001A8D1DDB|nr:MULTISPECIES: copper homeostasis periplasmic binding protein CopC [Novosphingobium]MBT0671748.1 copper homeostasis periplasmic binding protein CopC [Novosphingobium profundi]QSR16511.1 copper resistance protein CopC [Novosphingobium sp. KA1]